MKFTTSLLTAAALLSSASAVVMIVTETTTLTTITKESDQTKLVNALEDALSTYLATKTVDPKYSSYDKAFSDYIQTRSDAPASLIFNTYVTSTITSIPAWFSAMPNDVKEYAQSLADEQLKIAESVVKEGAAPKATGAVGMVGAGMAAVAAGAAILL